MGENRSWRRHNDQLRALGDVPQEPPPTHSHGTTALADDYDPEVEEEGVSLEQVHPHDSTTTESTTEVALPDSRYPQRERRPPERYSP